MTEPLPPTAAEPPAPGAEPPAPLSRKARLRRWRRRGLWIGLIAMLLTLLLVGALLFGAFWAAGSPRGTAWLLANLGRIGIGVQVIQPDGSLVGDFSAKQIIVTAGRTRVVIDDPRWQKLSVAYTPYPYTWARLRADSLHASRVTVTVKPGDGKKKDTGLPAHLQLPVEVEVDDVAIRELIVPGLADYPLREVQGRLHLGEGQGRLHRVDRLSVRAEPLRVTGSGRIAAVGDQSMKVVLDAVQADPAGATPGQVLPAWARVIRHDWEGHLDATGPLARFDAKLSIKGKGQSLQATSKIEPDYAWPLTELDLKTQSFDIASLVPRAPMTSLTGSIVITPADRAAGSAGGLRFAGGMVNARPGSWSERLVPVRTVKVDVAGRVRAAGPLDLSVFEALLSDGRRDAGVVRATGHWDAQRFQLKAELSNVRPGALDPGLSAMTLTGPLAVSGQWPEAPDGTRPPVPTFTATADLNGKMAEFDRAVKVKLDASGDGRHVEVKELHASAGGAKATLTGRAERQASAWQLNARAMLVDFDPQPWFPGNANPVWRSGTHRLNLKAQADLALADGPAADARHAPPDILSRLARLRGTGSVEIAPSVLAGTPLSGQVNLQHATASDPLKADASLDAGGNRVSANLEIAAGPDGSRDRWSVRADTPALARLAPLLKLIPGAAESGLLDAMAGSADAETQVRGRWPTMEVTGRANVDGLRAGPLTVGKGDLRWVFGTTPDAPLDLSATIDKAGWSTHQLGGTQLQLKGSASAHELTLRTEANAAPPAWTDGLPNRPRAASGAPSRTLLNVAAQGSLAGGFLEAARIGRGHSDAAAPGPLRWKGLLQLLELRSPHTGAKPWIATKNVGLEVETGASPRFVMAAGRADIFTAGLRWDRIEWLPNEGITTQKLDMQAELEPLAVAPLLASAQPEFGWGGDLRIGGKVVIKQNTDFSANIVLQRVSGDLTVTDDGGTQELGLSDLVIALNAQNGVWTFTQGLAGKQLGVAAGAFVATTSPQRAWPDANAPLQGVFEAQVENLGTWGAWVPTGWRLGGRLRTTASLGGRFGAPEYTGQMIGTGISVRNIIEGVNVTDGEVDVTLKGDTARIHRFSARGGNGTVQLSGDAQLGESPRAQLKLVADKFQLLGRVDRRIVVSGDGEVALDRDDIKVDGRFGVDEGLIDFTRSDAPALGNDVIVTNRTDNEPVAVPTPQRHRNVSINLAIGLGEKLRLKGRGIATGLQGELKITTPNGYTAFNGSIRAVGGTYVAYRQNLGIDRGIITFNGPVNDPRLDIEATRPDLDVRVGVSVTGTALNPRVRLFSDPEMSDIDKLSWLLLGRASDGLGSSDTALLQRAAMALLAGDSPGVTDQVLKTIGLDDLSVRQTEGDSRETVVSLGKQLSRRWYVGYERGLNATEGTWQLIYRIARRFTLRAQSGLDTSLDVIWTWRWD